MRTFDHDRSITGGTGHPLGLAAGKGRRWDVLPSWHVALWLTPEESARQRLWRGQRISNRLRATSGGETRGYRPQSPPIPTCVQWNFRMWLWGTPGYGGWPLNKINSFHNNIWFDLINFGKWVNTTIYEDMFILDPIEYLNFASRENGTTRKVQVNPSWVEFVRNGVCQVVHGDNSQTTQFVLLYRFRRSNVLKAKEGEQILERTCLW